MAGQNGVPPGVVAAIQITAFQDGRVEVKTHNPTGTVIVPLGMMEFAKAQMLSQKAQEGPKIEPAPPGLRFG